MVLVRFLLTAVQIKIIYLCIQAEQKTQSGFLKDMKYQTEISKPLSHVQFLLLSSQAEAVSSYS